MVLVRQRAVREEGEGTRERGAWKRGLGVARGGGSERICLAPKLVPYAMDSGFTLSETEPLWGFEPEK